MKKIVQDGDPVLRGIAAAVAEDQFGTPELRTIVADMEEALDAEKDGVALAAPQIAIPLRIFVVRYDRLQPPEEGVVREPELGVYINPEFVKSSRRREVMDEGCLSVRGTYGKTYRHDRATVRARTVDGFAFERGGGGILAQVFQHETDHLNGILFIDHAIETYNVTKEEAERASKEGVAPEAHD
jgi:peptide deformylase